MAGEVQDNVIKGCPTKLWLHNVSLFYMVMLCILTLPPMGYQILWLPWGVSEAPLRNQGRSYFWPHVAIKHFLLDIFRGHMQKISQKSQNLSKISGFQKNFKFEISRHLGKRKIDITRLILKIQDSNFTCKHDFYRRKNPIMASRSKEHFLIDWNMIFSKKSSGCTSLWGP